MRLLLHPAASSYACGLLRLSTQYSVLIPSLVAARRVGRAREEQHHRRDGDEPPIALPLAAPDGFAARRRSASRCRSARWRRRAAGRRRGRREDATGVGAGAVASDGGGGAGGRAAARSGDCTAAAICASVTGGRSLSPPVHDQPSTSPSRRTRFPAPRPACATSRPGRAGSNASKGRGRRRTCRSSLLSATRIPRRRSRRPPCRNEPPTLTLS